MADVLTRKNRSALMAKIRARGNKATEIVFANVLRAHRISGWRRHLPLPGNPDFAFRAARVAVFIDGCFWHGCHSHCRFPATNRAYWLKKIAGNKARHRSVRSALRKSGWRVIRIWEHELKNPARCAERLLRLLAA